MQIIQQTPFKVPTTHAEFNACLTQYNLPKLSNHAINTLQNQESNTRLFNALSRAQTDKNSLLYLQNVIMPLADNSRRSDAPSQNKERIKRVLASTNQDDVASINDNQRVDSHHTVKSTSIKKHLSHHAYAVKSAVCFNVTEYNERDTITIDGAPAVAPRKFNWPQKISLTLTAVELPQVACVFLGLLDQCEFSNHGPQKNKGFKVVNQKDSIFINLFEKGKPSVAVPISPSDVFFISNLFTKQLASNQPWLSPSDVVASLQHTISRLARQ